MKLATIFVAGFVFVAQKTVFSQGTIAFDSFGPNGSYNYWAALPIGSGRTHAGFPFSPTVSGQLESIQLPIANVGLFQSRSVDVAICRLDAQTGYPTTTIELFSNQTAPQRSIDPVSPISIRSSQAPIIEANTEYWLVVSAPQGGEFEWYAIPRDVTGKYYFNGSAQGGEGYALAGPPSAFRITVTAVPEPVAGSFVMFGLAVFATVKGRFARRNQLSHAESSATSGAQRR